ncbi:MAG: tRNA lysidine(34) synthetase TilS, partial [Candidatus Omnitrophica bacterium]|nr:tRNA lysidine(34) synthetase TilS [Candidatus Omnitrophota bacterium]
MKKILSSLPSRLEEHLRDKRFFKARQKILVACSGGPDSVALFHLLQSLAARNSWELVLIHFNHQLRPQAAKRDEDFVRRLAAKYKVGFFCGTGSVGLEAKKTKTSIEECARQMRYDFFLRTMKAKKFPLIVLAHTRDDQAETVLMRVLQGTGLRGLQGIREKFRVGRATLIRPLLVFTKKELLQYLAEQKISYRSDKTNDSSRFVR